MSPSVPVDRTTLGSHDTPPEPTVGEEPTARVARIARMAPVAAGAALAATATYVARVDPAVGGPAFVRCPLNALTGWQCPMCGMTRATHALLHGDIGSALTLNPLTPLAIAVIVTGWALWLARDTLRVAAPRLEVGPRMATVALVGLGLFAVVRNL